MVRPRTIASFFFPAKAARLHPAGTCVVEQSMQIGTRLAFVSALLVCGCQPSATEACRDFLTAFGQTAERCGYDRAATEMAIEDDIRATYGSGCGGADRIRDSDDFYDVCLPFIETLTCEEYESSTLTLPPECIDQLLYLM